MAIVNMNKLSLIGLKSDKERILETLMKMGSGNYRLERKNVVR